MNAVTTLSGGAVSQIEQGLAGKARWQSSTPITCEEGSNICCSTNAICRSTAISSYTFGRPGLTPGAEDNSLSPGSCGTERTCPSSLRPSDFLSNRLPTFPLLHLFWIVYFPSLSLAIPFTSSFNFLKIILFVIFLSLNKVYFLGLTKSHTFASFKAPQAGQERPNTVEPSGKLPRRSKDSSVFEGTFGNLVSGGI